MVFEDLRRWSVGDRRTTDVCVVGAGPAGLALARSLAARGVDVLLVESGGLNGEGRAGHLDESTIVGRPYNYPVSGRARGFGGSTSLWAGQCVELRPHDLQLRPWVAHSGWPIRHEDLRPYLARAAALLEVADRLPVDEVREARGIAGRSFGPACEEFATVFAPRLDLGERFRGDIGRSTRVVCLLHATAVALHRDRDRRRVERLTVSTTDGQRASISAAAFVLCAGGVENARLLLAAADEGIAPGDRYGQVGRYLQEHPSAMTVRMTTTDTRSLLANFDLAVHRGLRYWPKLATTPFIEHEVEIAAASASLEIEWGQPEAVLAARALVQHVRRRRAPARSVVGDAFRRLPHILSASYRAAGAQRGWPAARPVRMGLRVQVEQEPNPASRVTLGRDRDALGTPRAQVDWRLSSLDARTLGTATRLFASALSGSGLAAMSHVHPSRGALPDVVDEAYHPSGTTRMSETERSGAVDARLRVHGTANLFACGSSVFPTVGYANPTQTLCALALRLADHLVERVVTGGHVVATRVDAVRAGQDRPR